MFQSFYARLQGMNVPIHEHVSVNTDGPPAANNENSGLTGLLIENILRSQPFLVTTASFISKLYVQN
jgi:hypothetical protein